MKIPLRNRKHPISTPHPKTCLPDTHHSQRHHVLHDQKVPGAEYCSLKELGMKGRYSVSNSHLSEFGVLGFELGFSMATPHSLGIV